MSPFDGLIAQGRMRANEPLGPMTTYKVGGPARWFMEVESEQDLVDLAVVAIMWMAFSVTPVGDSTKVIGFGDGGVFSCSATAVATADHAVSLEYASRALTM